MTPYLQIMSRRAWLSAGMAAGFALLAPLAPAKSEPDVSAKTPLSEAILQPVTEMADLIQKYKLPLDPQAASKAVVEALIHAADPSSRVMTETELLQMNEQQMGIVYEPAFEFTATNNSLPAVAKCAPESDAAQAGLKAGELIEKIDDFELLSGATAADVARRLRAGAPTPVRLSVRDAAGKSREVKVAREERRLPAVDVAEELPVGFCYLKLNGLYQGSGKAVVSTLRGWSEAGRFGVVIDARGAGGRDLDSVSEIASLFAEGGALLFSVRDSQDQDLQVYKALAGSHLGMPAMVLVDAKTTGASEVLAAVLAASVRGAMLIGRKTSGDPMVREVIPLPAGERLYVATRKLSLANGEILNGRDGLAPDVSVTEEEDIAKVDYEPAAPQANGKELSAEELEDRRLRERVRNDTPLRRAVDVLLGLKALNIRGLGSPETPAN